MHYYYWKNPLNFGVDPTEGDRLAAIFDFSDNMLHMDHMQNGGAI